MANPIFAQLKIDKMPNGATVPIKDKSGTIVGRASLDKDGNMIGEIESNAIPPQCVGVSIESPPSKRANNRYIEVKL